MDDRLQIMFQKWDEFKHTHTKKLLPQLREEILTLCQQAHLELDADAKLHMEDHEHSLSLRITANTLLTSDEAPILRQLVSRSHTFHTYIQDNNIVWDLWFAFWEWIPNQ